MKVTVAICKLLTSVHKGRKWWKRKISAHTFKLPSCHFPWDYPDAQLLSPKWLNKISWMGVCCTNDRLKSSDGSDINWMVPLLKVRWKKSCTLYISVQIPVLLNCSSPNLPGCREQETISAQGGIVSITPDFSYSDLIPPQSFQNYRLNVGSCLPIYCIWLYKYLSP